MKKSLSKLWLLQTARLGESAEPAVMNGIRLSLHAQAAVNVLVAVDIHLRKKSLLLSQAKIRVTQLSRGVPS